MSTATTTEAFFETMYRSNPDPWDFAESAYENLRYDTTMDALGMRRYARAFEPGCSVGVLTKRLTQQCDIVEAMDISATAVAEARRRCVNTNAIITQGSLPGDFPAGRFDLIIASEIGYYFDESTLGAHVELMTARLEPGGTLLAVHWTGSSPDHVLSGDRVHEIFGGVSGLRRETSERYVGFRLERWERV